MGNCRKCMRQEGKGRGVNLASTRIIEPSVQKPFQGRLSGDEVAGHKRGPPLYYLPFNPQNSLQSEYAFLQSLQIWESVKASLPRGPPPPTFTQIRNQSPM